MRTPSADPLTDVVYAIQHAHPVVSKIAADALSRDQMREYGPAHVWPPRLVDPAKDLEMLRETRQRRVRVRAAKRRDVLRWNDTERTWEAMCQM